jgi:hypothetical protein
MTASIYPSLPRLTRARRLIDASLAEQLTQTIALRIRRFGVRIPTGAQNEKPQVSSLTCGFVISHRGSRPADLKFLDALLWVTAWSHRV